MDFVQLTENLFTAIIEGGLGWKEAPNGPCFFLYLNYGQIWVKTDPKSVLEIVALARGIAIDESYGDHNAILNLVTERSKVTENTVYWRAASDVAAHRYPPGYWITVWDWLNEQGQSPDYLFSVEWLADRNKAQ